MPFKVNLKGILFFSKLAVKIRLKWEMMDFSEFPLLAVTFPKIRERLQPLYADFLDEIQSAVVFPQVLQIHQKILKVIPLAVPEEEQTYFLANVYSLVLDQPQVLEQLG